MRNNRTGLWGKRLDGLLQSWHRGFSGPQSPLTLDTAETHNLICGASGKIYLRAKIAETKRNEDRKNGWETTLRTAKSLMDEETLLQTQEQIMRCAPWSHHTLAEEKHEGKGASERSYCELVIDPFFIPLQPLLRGGRRAANVGIKWACEERQKWKESGFLFICVLISYHSDLF